MFIHNSVLVTSLLQLLLTTSLQIWLFIRKKFLVRFLFVATLTLYNKPLISSTQTIGVTEPLFSLNQDQLPENSNMKSKLVKSESTSQFQFHYQCSHSLETKNLFMEILTSTERTVSNSSLNGKQSPQDGKKNMNLLNFQLHSQLINELNCMILEKSLFLFNRNL